MGRRWRAVCGWTAAGALLLAGCDDGGGLEPGPESGAPTFDGAIDRALADAEPPEPDAAPADLAIDAALPDLALPDLAVDAAPDAEIPDAEPPAPGCPDGYARPRITGNLADEALAEVSGLAASPSRPGVLWMHTDSGGEPRLYAVDAAGALRGSVEVPVPNVDWEDLALAACPDGAGACLWIADTGDNRRARDDAVVYAVHEPVVVGGVAERVWRFPVRYPDGPVDVEALAVAPDGAAFWLFEKVDGPIARVFGHRDPLVDREPVALVETTRINSPGVAIVNGRSITGADLHPEGGRLLLRVYTGSYEYVFGPGQGVADLPFITADTVALGPLDEPQGEAIAYDADGRAVWTVSEDPERIGGQPLHRYDCRD